MSTVLLSLVAATASSASTPEDAACDLPPPPAIVDCNDPLASVWVEEMIGSCDMPPARADVSLVPVAPQKPRAAQTRLCLGGECGVDNVPLRQGPRDSDSAPRLLSKRLTFHHAVVITRLVLTDEALPELLQVSRLDRPPRA